MNAQTHSGKRAGSAGCATRLSRRDPRQVRLVLGLVVFFSSMQPLQAQTGMREGDQRERADYLRRLDAYPNDEVALDARLRAWEKFVASGISFRLSQLPGRGAFTPLGPFGAVMSDGAYHSAPQADGGRVSTIAVHPSNPRLYYIGIAGGGIWKTTDDGFTWRAVSDTECSMSIAVMQLDPVTPDVVYAATGDFLGPTGGCGILRSTNGGESWTQLATTVAKTWGTVRGLTLVESSAGNVAGTILIAATQRGLWRSSDGAVSWTRLFDGDFTDVVAHPTDPNIVYASTWGGYGDLRVLRSGDRGATWQSIVAGLPPMGRTRLAVSAARPDALWLVAGGTRYEDPPAGLFRWTAGTGFQKLPAVGFSGTDASGNWFVLTIAVDQADADRIYLGAIRAFRSLDGGASFGRMGGNVHVDWHVMKTHRGDTRRLYAGNDGGAFISSNRGDAFIGRNQGLNTMLFYPGIAVHPTIPGFVVGGTQDNGSMRSGGFSVFEGVFGGDGAYAAINPQDPSIFWTSCQSAGYNNCILRWSGTTFSLRSSGISRQDRHPFIAPLVMSPTRGTRLYYATQRLWRTVDDGLSWNAVSGDLTKGGSGTIAAIAEAKGDSNVVYVATSDGNVWITKDFATTWTNITGALPNRALTDVAINEQDASRAYVAVSGYGSSHLFRTDDAGSSWTDVGDGLPDVPTHAVLQIPGTNQVFVGTDLGVFQSPTGSAPWSLVPGIPLVRTTDLVFQQAYNLVIAATYGRGLWSMDIGPATSGLRGDANGDGVINAADALLIQQVITGKNTGQLNPAFRGDANCDGLLNSLDAILVLRHAVGAPTSGACVGTIR